MATKNTDMLKRYRSAMLLAGAGDALGYKNAEWEFCRKGRFIHEELERLGGLGRIEVNRHGWMVSDDTVMHLATAQALVSPEAQQGRIDMYHEMARQYIECMKDMTGRAPGGTCKAMTRILKPGMKDGYKVPFNNRGGGCGAAMRSMCIGLRYPRPEDLKDLIAVSIESGRMTHHHPVGFLGALTSALFTAYSIQGKPPVEWGQGLLDVLPQALQYVLDSGHYPQENINAWPFFETQWKKYVELRKLASGEAHFPDNYHESDVRDAYYKSISIGGWGGACGHDSTLIAYDAILGAGQDWMQLCMRGMFHGGDSDSTGTIAACWYGAMYGLEGVPQGNYKNLEYRDRLETLGKKLYNLTVNDAADQGTPEEALTSDVKSVISQLADTQLTDSRLTDTELKCDVYIRRMATSSSQHNGVSMLERYKAAMVLAGVGDALGYKNGEWEFCHSGKLILKDLKNMGGLEKIKVNKRDWMVSDDTVMHLATGEALVSEASSVSLVETYYDIARMYKECMKDMAGRAPGATCMMMTHKLKPNVDDGYKIPFNSRGGGCGASMRAMCIGLRYPRPEDLNDLIAVSIESGRMTHHHPTGYLGALASALFTAFSIQGKPPVEWGQGLLDVLPQALQYVLDSRHYPEENINAWPFFKEHWELYVESRKLAFGKPVFPDDYEDPDVRDDFYKSISFGGWGGASGHDSTIIAYDAVLGAGQDWKKLCIRGMFHGGDSDSTGTIAACWYGAMYGFQGVPKGNYKNLEYRDRLERLAEELYNLAQTSRVSQDNPEEMDGSDVDPKHIKKDSRNEDSCYSKSPGTDEGETMEEPKDEEEGCKMEYKPTDGTAEKRKGQCSRSATENTGGADPTPPRQVKMENVPTDGTAEERKGQCSPFATENTGGADTTTPPRQVKMENVPTDGTAEERKGQCSPFATENTGGADTTTPPRQVKMENVPTDGTAEERKGQCSPSATENTGDADTTTPPRQVKMETEPTDGTAEERKAQCSPSAKEKNGKC
ncbi:uncharacterized protein LOC124259643 [Haliotis rubra]|uniref:uncharacterized protein LOC124259643 n=1 Tax=Haliotis rubra TaxID=36100 RepID=UPI001EE54931|nr:uncharacterized protein LOC124259643 [Haliotis rubra]